MHLGTMMKMSFPFLNGVKFPGNVASVSDLSAAFPIDAGSADSLSCPEANASWLFSEL